MTFVNNKQTNLAEWQLFAWISASQTSLILKTSQWWLFPSTFPFNLKIEKYDTSSTLEDKPVTKREIVSVTNRSGDTFTIVRWSEECPASDTAVTQTTTNFAFDADDFVFLVQTAWDDKDVKDELIRLETDKADDSTVVHNTGDEAVAWVKTFPSSPIVPTPTTDFQASTKKYVDDEIVDSWYKTVLTNSDYICWEDISEWESLFLEWEIEYDLTNITDTPTFPLNITPAATSEDWYVINPKKDLSINYVTKHSQCNWTRCVIKTIGDVELAEATFIWDVATFTSPIILNVNTEYKVLIWSDWASYTAYAYNTWGATLSWTSNNITIVRWTDWFAWSAWYWRNLLSITTYNSPILSQNVWDVVWNTRVSKRVVWSWVAWNSVKLSLAKVNTLWEDLLVRIETDSAWSPSWTLVDGNATATIARADLTTSLVDETITLDWSITIAKWTTAHIVISQEWDDVDPARYFKVWFSTKNTTTRGSALYNATRGTIDDDINIYTDSDIFEQYLLSLTDAKYTYKLPDVPRIAIDDYISWELVRYDFSWISKRLTGLTKDSDYYLSDTPWVLSITPWTNLCILWKSIDTDELLLGKKLLSIPITVEASPFTRTNTTWKTIQIKITWGTVNPIVLDWITVATATNHINTIPNWKAIVITYSSLPTIVYSDI